MPLGEPKVMFKPKKRFTVKSKLLSKRLKTAECMLTHGSLINPHLVRKAIDDSKAPRAKFVGEKERTLKSQKNETLSN